MNTRERLIELLSGDCYTFDQIQECLPDIPVADLAETFNVLSSEGIVVPFSRPRCYEEEGKLIDDTSYAIAGSTFEDSLDEFSTERYEAESEPGDQGAYLGE